MKRAILIVAVLFVAIPAFAQQPRQQPSPEETKKMMTETFETMLPLMGKMMETMIQSQLAVVSQPDAADKMARYAKNFYEALLKQGFTKEEALRIVTSLAMPSASPQTK